MISVLSVVSKKMELEFDKEMDTILRRAGRGVLVGDSPPAKPKHVDADEIAAFVENVLPARTRALYMEHFADCDRCRKILASTMLMAGDAVAPAASAVTEQSKELAIPAVSWYQKLFRTPNLAVAMGALVLVFGGVLGVMVLQNRQAEQNSSVAQVTESERQPGGPSLNETTVANAAAPAANIAPAIANTANSNSYSAAPFPGAISATPSTDKPAAPAGRPDLSFSGGVPADADVAGGEVRPKEEERQPIAKGAPAPPPRPGVVADGVDVGRAEAKAAEPAKDDTEDRLSLKRKQTEEARSRDLPAAPAKSGPARSGPLNMQQNQIATQNITEMPVTRSAGGKTFNNKNGAWYDSAYKNQATMNFRRGTDEYKKLDSGLRSIADQIGGTVVLVWKGKAFRIQ